MKTSLRSVSKWVKRVIFFRIWYSNVDFWKTVHLFSKFGTIRKLESTAGVFKNNWNGEDRLLDNKIVEELTPTLPTVPQTTMLECIFSLQITTTFSYYSTYHNRTTEMSNSALFLTRLNHCRTSISLRKIYDALLPSQNRHSRLH